MSDTHNQGETICERTQWAGQDLMVTWREGPFRPPRHLTTQASGVCFTAQGEIVLVSSDGQGWALPGGHPEPEETLEEALRREIAEEACAQVEDARYLGAQQVDAPEGTRLPARYYQARFWARVSLLPFHPRFERRHRRLVDPGGFCPALGWDTQCICQALLQAALAVEAQARETDR